MRPHQSEAERDVPDDQAHRAADDVLTVKQTRRSIASPLPLTTCDEELPQLDGLTGHVER